MKKFRDFIKEIDISKFRRSSNIEDMRSEPDLNMKNVETITDLQKELERSNKEYQQNLDSPQYKVDTDSTQSRIDAGHAQFNPLAKQAGIDDIKEEDAMVTFRKKVDAKRLVPSRSGSKGDGGGSGGGGGK